MSFNEDVADAIVSHRIYLHRYEGGAVRDLADAYDEALGPLFRELEQIARRAEKAGELLPMDRRRLWELARAIDVQGAELARVFRELIQERIEGAADAETRIVGGKLVQLAPEPIKARLGVAPAVQDQITAAARTVGGMAGDRLEASLFENRNVVRAVMFRAVSSGRSVPNIVRDLRQASSIRETYKGRLTTIARTEIMSVSNQSAMGVYKANLDVLKGVQYLATLDSRTCPICAPDHNVVMLFDANGTPRRSNGDPAPTLPRHPRCRCFYAPLTKSWAELGLGDKLEDLDGDPANEMTYEQWLRRQPASVADDVLGATRAKMWRKGTLPLDAFSNDDRVLTLRELEALTSAQLSV